MAKSPRRETFADLVNQPTWSETKESRTGQYSARPGAVNVAGEFFDPTGHQLPLQEEDASVEEAQRLVDAGALVIAEDCGCGGMFGGGDDSCTPQWLTSEQLRRLRRGPAPRFTGRRGTPTWLEVWASDESTVVFAHGDVSGERP